MGLYGYTAYSGSKFAIRGLAETLHSEVSSETCKWGPIAQIQNSISGISKKAPLFGKEW